MSPSSPSDPEGGRAKAIGRSGANREKLSESWGLTMVWRLIIKRQTSTGLALRLHERTPLKREGIRAYNNINGPRNSVSCVQSHLSLGTGRLKSRSTHQNLKRDDLC